MHPLHHDQALDITRRHFLGQCKVGLGAIALASLGDPALGGDRPDPTSVDPLAPRAPHFPARAKNVIVLHMAGSPPQHDLLDNKPMLRELDGQPCPDSYLKGERFAFIKGHPKLLGSPFKFQRHGQSGNEFSELLPRLARHADDLCIVKSMYTDQFNHAPAQMLFYTGSPAFGRPAFGSWITYGLGSLNRDLPGFVVLVSGGKVPSSGKSVWGSGFLPSIHQGVQCRSKGEPVLYLDNPPGIDRDLRRRSLDALGDLNRRQLEEFGDGETRTRIAQYELAFRMQTAVPDAMDIGRESEATQQRYGAQPGQASFGNNCLLARRLVERGVRFVQLFDWGWDYHGNARETDIVQDLPRKCKITDRAVAALIEDLKLRGLLDDTLVLWTGEFGRTPMNEERNGSKFLGRDHHPHCYSVVMAGGGIKPGITYGATDELGYYITENPVHVHDLQATLLHLLGFEHEQLTYRFQGRDYRLTDVHGEVVRGLLA